MSINGVKENETTKENSDKESIEKGQVNFRVNSKKKDRWREFVEQSQFNSLSDFIRKSAENEIGRQRLEEESDETEPTSFEAADEILDTLEQINTKLQSMEQRLKVIEADQYDDERLEELVPEVYHHLPSSITEIQKEQQKKLDGLDGNTGSVEDLARELGEDQPSIEMAIQRLRSTTPSVKQTRSNVEGEGSETTHYYKEE